MLYFFHCRLLGVHHQPCCFLSLTLILFFSLHKKWDLVGKPTALHPSIAVVVLWVNLPSWIVACTAELQGISLRELDMGRIVNNPVLSYKTTSSCSLKTISNINPWLIGWLVDWLIGWLVDWLISTFILLFCEQKRKHVRWESIWWSVLPHSYVQKDSSCLLHPERRM